MKKKIKETKTRVHVTKCECVIGEEAQVVGHYSYTTAKPPPSFLGFISTVPGKYTLKVNMETGNCVLKPFGHSRRIELNQVEVEMLARKLQEVADAKLISN